MPAEKTTHEVAAKTPAGRPPRRPETDAAPAPPARRHSAAEEGKPQQVKPDGR